MYPIHMLDFEISASEAKDLLAACREKRCMLLDVREPWEHEEASIVGSVIMPMGDIPSRAHHELDPESRIIVICHHGVRSMSVTVWLREQGFDLAQSLRGGIDAWSKEVDGTIPRY